MNRRVKFLMVEGIQKRKNPDKNYVSTSVYDQNRLEVNKELKCLRPLSSFLVF